MRLTVASEYFHKLELVKSPAQMIDLLMGMVSNHGVAGVFVARLPGSDHDLEPNILLRGWSDEWIIHYARSKYVKDDPIAKELRRTNAPYLWSEVCRSRKLSVREDKIMREAQQACLVEGLTVPILDVGLRTTCVSFSTPALPLDREARETLRQVAYMSVEKLETFGRSASARSRLLQTNVALAPRETECLALAGKGLSSREIGRQLGLSSRTVDQYVDSAVQRLGASNRTEAVTLAVKYRLVD